MLVEAGPGTREIWPRLTRTWSQLDLDPSRWVPKGLLEHLGSLAAPVIHWSWGPAWPWAPSATRALSQSCRRGQLRRQVGANGAWWENQTRFL